MADYTETDKAPATGIAGTVLGSIGTAGALGLFNGGLGNLFGGSAAQSSQSQKIAELMQQVAILQSEKTTDTKLVDVYTTLRTADKAQDEKIAALSSRVLSLETAAPLREQIVMDQVNAVSNTLGSSIAAVNASIANTNGMIQSQIACINKTLGGITAIYVPASQVTPEPMSKFNSWTAPTTTATTA